jgi:glycerol kinase
VSEFFQVQSTLGDLSPLTKLTEAQDSSSAISSGESLTDSAPIFWLKFSILVVPGMGHTSAPWWWTQARASWDGVHPFFVAIALIRSNIRAFNLTLSGWNLGKACKF